jgi:hypothetical protein
LGGLGANAYGPGVLGGAVAGVTETSGTFFPIGFTSGASTHRFALPVGATARDLRVRLSNPPTGDGIGVAISIGGSNQIGCVVPGGQTTCTDDSANAPWAAGDRIVGVLFPPETGSFSGDVEFGYRLTN